MKFRRKKTEGGQVAEASSEASSAVPAEAAPEPAAAPVDAARAHGPWDDSEVELVEGTPGKVDLGSLVVTPREGVELQLQDAA